MLMLIARVESHLLRCQLFCVSLVSAGQHVFTGAASVVDDLLIQQPYNTGICHYLGQICSELTLVCFAFTLAILTELNLPRGGISFSARNH